MKTTFLITTTCIAVLGVMGCSGTRYKEELNEKWKGVNDTLAVGNYSLDSMQNQNRLIDGLSAALKRLPEIDAIYDRNLKASKRILREQIIFINKH